MRGYLSAMEFCDLLSKVKPDAASSYQGMFAAVSALIEFLEYFFPLPLFDADAVIPKTYQLDILTLFESNADAGSARNVVFLGIGQNVHQEHLHKRYDDRLIESLLLGIFNVDVTFLEDMAVARKKTSHQFHKVDVCKYPFIDLTLNPGKVQDTADIVGKAFCVLEHEANIFELLIAGDFMLCKGLQIKLQRGYRGLELMGEVADESLLEAIELEGFQVIYEDDEYPSQDDANQQGQNKDDNPGAGLNKLAWIELVTMGE